MDKHGQAAQRWAEALSAPTEENTGALAAFLAEQIVTVAPTGTAEGKEAVVAGFGQSPLASFFAQGTWSEPSSEGEAVELTCTFPARAPIGGVTLRLTFDGDAHIDRVETGILPAPPPEPTDIKLTEAMRSAVNGALANGTPIIVAYADQNGQPHLSLRGTTQVFSDDQLAIWVRNPHGGLLSAIETNPHLAVFYRDPASRAAYQFHGRAHADSSDETRDRVYSNSPELERNMDLQRRGVAVVLDLERVEGRDASGPLLMTRSARR